MNRYLLFAGENYYPFGGFADYVGSRNSITEVKEELLNNNSYDWWHIVDSEKGIIVERQATLN